jgi:hypothetical protein
MLEHSSNEAVGKQEHVSLIESNILVHTVTDQSRFAQYVGRNFPGSSIKRDTYHRMATAL